MVCCTKGIRDYVADSRKTELAANVFPARDLVNTKAIRNYVVESRRTGLAANAFRTRDQVNTTAGNAHV
jgi:hypothetical protein